MLKPAAGGIIMTTDDCKHEADPIIYRSGGQHFTAGEPWDDIVEHVICSICGEHMDCERGCKEMEIPFDSHPRCETCEVWDTTDLFADTEGWCRIIHDYTAHNFYCPRHSNLKDKS